MCCHFLSLPVTSCHVEKRALMTRAQEVRNASRREGVNFPMKTAQSQYGILKVAGGAQAVLRIVLRLHKKTPVFQGVFRSGRGTTTPCRGAILSLPGTFCHYFLGNSD